MMENSKLIIASAMVLTSVCAANAQTFNKTLFSGQTDYNHYSVERLESSYVLAGTLFDNSSGNNNIHVVRLDQNGTIMWERVIDESNDDRGLDICIGPENNIAVTGHILNGLGNQNLYVVELDQNGNFIQDTRDVLQYDNISAGTNIIYSESQLEYYVGGFRGSDVLLSNNPPYVDHGYGIVVRFDNGLNYISHTEFTSTTVDYHSSINDIVEVTESNTNDDGIFVTGTIGKLGNKTDVLATRLRYDLSLVYNSSFESSVESNIGVSAVYDQRDQEIYLLSNNGSIRQPQLTTIDENTGSHLSNYLLNIPSNISEDGTGTSGFHLRKSKSNPSTQLVAAGYFKKYRVGATDNNAVPWIAELDKSGNILTTHILPSPSDGFPQHGGGIFSTFRNPHPYIFNQEIFCEGVESADYLLLSPRTVNSDYGLELSAFNIPLAEDLCFKDINSYAFEVCEQSIAINSYFPDKTFNSPKAPLNEFTSEEEQFCEGGSGEAESIPGGFRLKSEPSSGEILNSSIDVYPNPFKNSISIKLEGSDLKGRILISNSVGKTIYESENISGDSYNERVDLSSESKGIYLIKLVDGEELKMKKVIKL